MPRARTIARTPAQSIVARGLVNCNVRLNYGGMTMRLGNMKKLPANAWHMLSCHEQQNIVNTGLEKYLKGEGDGIVRVWIATIRTRDDFLTLQLLHQNVSVRLTPPGQPRELQAIIYPLLEEGKTFAGLRDECSNEAERDWYEKCRSRYEHFDYSKMTRIAITPAAKAEATTLEDDRSYEIFEGQHRSLALAMRLLKDGHLYPADGLEVYVVFPRSH